MYKTVRVKITDAEIKRAIKNADIKRLRDVRYPIELRFHKNRESGSFYYINKRKTNGKNGKPVWQMLGYWPQMPAKKLFDILPEKIVRDIVEPGNVVWDMQTFDVVLKFFLAHTQTANNISESRKATVKWAINKYLLEMVGDMRIDSVTKSKIKDKLIWPLQDILVLSSVLTVWGVLKAAFKQCLLEKRITLDPLEKLVVQDFIHSHVQPKTGRLRENLFVKTAASINDVPLELRVLFTLQIAFGTRLTETRCAKWCEIDLEKKVWRIPKEITKTKAELILPLSDYLVDVLTRYKEEQGAGQRFVFPNKRLSAPISATKCGQLYKRISNDEWTSHDCRKFAKTKMTELGIDKYISERILNHKISNLDETYIYSALMDQKRKAINLYHDWLFNSGLFLFYSEDPEKI